MRFRCFWSSSETARQPLSDEFLRTMANLSWQLKSPSRHMLRTLMQRLCSSIAWLILLTLDYVRSIAMNIDELWLATLTKNEDDAGTDADRLNVTVNIDGDDIVDADFDFLTTDGALSGGFGPDDENWLGQGQGALSGSIVSAILGGKPLETP